MSGPKGGAYDVEQNRRREQARRHALSAELAQLRARLARAEAVADAHREAGARIAAVDTRVGVDESSAESLEAAIRVNRTKLADVTRATDSALAELARRGTLDALRGSVGPVRARTSAEVAHQLQVPPVEVLDRSEEAEEALAALDPDLASEQPGLLELVQQLPRASRDAGDALLYDLRHRVAALNRTAERRREIVAEIHELLLSLMGVGGTEATEVRRRLEAMIDDGGEPDDRLRRHVAEAIERRRLIEDRLYMADMMRESLESLGYDVGAEFSVELMDAGAALIHRAGWTEHALEVRMSTSSESVVFSAVREGDPGQEVSSEQVRRDVEVEVEFCTTIDPLLADLSERGVSLGPLQRHEAGANPVRVVRGREKSAEQTARRTPVRHQREAE